jgi:RNA polymerase-binding transcription factor DksA
MAKKSQATKSRSHTKSKKPAPRKVSSNPTRKAPAKKKVVKAMTPKGKKSPSTTKKAAKKGASKPAPKKKGAAGKAVVKPVNKRADAVDTLVNKSNSVNKASSISTTKSRAKRNAAHAKTDTKPVTGTGRLPSSIRVRAKLAPPPAFTFEEVLKIIKSNENHTINVHKKAVPAEPAPVKAAPDLDEIKPENRVLGAASLADILGYTPGSKTPREDEEKTIPKKHIRFYRLLVELREHVNTELGLHTKDTLKHSSKDDSGDLSSNSQHITDAGTDTFDLDFALSLVSNEQEALYEIEEAIKRIRTRTYGTCELTGKQISKERLLAVPFARYSVESQAQVEKTTRHSVQRGNIFGDTTIEDSA